MENNTLEENLNLVIEDLYRGLNELAARAKAGESPEEVLLQMAGDICKHWPNCKSEHELPDDPQGKSASSNYSK